MGHFSQSLTDIDSINAPLSIYCTDLDNDNDNDIIAASFLENKIVWYVNDSTGNFGNRNKISYSLTAPKKFALSDINGDNLKDLLVGSSDELINEFWFKNNGNGEFYLEDTINTGFAQVYDLCMSDLDSDSLEDLITLYNYGALEYIGWNKQITPGNFGPIQIISDSAWAGKSVFMADMDGDGDNDLLFGSVNGAMQMIKNCPYGKTMVQEIWELKLSSLKGSLLLM